MAEASKGAASADESGKRRFVTKGTEAGEAIGATGKKPPINYITTLIHLAKGYVGTGIFAMGQAFLFSGHALGLSLLASIAVMNLYCQHVIVAVAAKISEEEAEDVRPTFSETVEYTMEKSKVEWLKKHAAKFGLMTTVFLAMAELGFCCVYFVFISEHVIEIVSAFDNSTFKNQHDPKSKHLMLALILVPMWATTFLGTLKLLMPLSLLSNVVMWTGIILVVYFTLTGPAATDCRLVSDGKNMHRFFGTTLFAFEGITFVIPLRNEMKHPEQFVSPLGVLNTGMTFVCILYSMVGFLGYYKYGSEIEPSVFLNLPEDALALATKGLISFGVMLTFTLHMYIPFEITYPLFHRKYGPFKHELLAKCLYRSVPVLLTWTLANIVPFLGLFISLVGAATGAMLALIIPPVVDLIAFKGELGVCQVIINVFIASVGVGALFFGTIMSIYDIVNELIKEYS